MRLLVPPGPVSGPVVDAIPVVMLLAGAGLVLLERGLRGGGSFPAGLLALPLLLLPGTVGASVTSLARGLDYAAAALAGFAFRDLVLRDGLRGAVLRLLLALAVFLALLAIAQSLYQRAEVRAAAETAADPLAGTALGKSFLASDRAAATFVNPNVLAGFLLLVLPLPILARRQGTPWIRTAAPWLLLVLASGFAAAGSGGATLALAFGIGLLLLLRPPVAPAARRLAVAGLAAGVLALAGLVTCLAAGWSPAFLGSKVATLGERASYHLLGFRLLPEAGLRGLGFDLTREMTSAVQRPGEPWSAHLHDSWLELALEGGPLLLAAAVPFVLALRRLARGGGSVGTEGPPVRSLGLALHAGALAGAVLVSSRGFARSVTLWPLAWDLPWLDAATAAGVFLAVLWIPRRCAADTVWWRPALAVALGAFAVHGFLDFDLQVPSVATSLGVVLALLPGLPPGRPRRWAFALAGAVGLTLPLAAGAVALDRDATAGAAEEIRRVGDASGIAAGTLWHHAPTDLDALEALVMSGGGRKPEAPDLFERLPDRVRQTPRARRLEARHLVRLALLDPSRARNAVERIPELVRPAERASSGILHQLALAHLIDQDPEGARRAARASLDAAVTWRLDDEDAPWIPEIRRMLGP